MYREHRVLQIKELDDAPAARHAHGTVGELPAGGDHLARRFIGAAGRSVRTPGRRHRPIGAYRVRTAQVHAAQTKGLVLEPTAHVHGCTQLPAEQLLVKCQRRLTRASGQLTPGKSGLARCAAARTRQRPEDAKPRAFRIRQHGCTADGGHVRRGTQDARAQAHSLRHARIHVRDADVAAPVRAGAHSAGFIGQ